MLVATQHDGNNGRIALFLIALDGSHSAIYDISGSVEGSNSVPPSAVIDTQSARVLVASSNFNQRPAVFVATLEGSFTMMVNMSAGQGATSDTDPVMLLDSTTHGRRLLVITHNNANSGVLGYFQVHHML